MKVDTSQPQMAQMGADLKAVKSICVHLRHLRLNKVEFIHMALPQSDRIRRLNAIAIRQMRTLTARTVKQLEGGAG